MTMNPRDAAKAKGCIGSVISFAITKLLPHVPEMTTTFTPQPRKWYVPHGPNANQLRLLGRREAS